MNICPEVVTDSAKYLTMKPLYKEHVTFNTNSDVERCRDIDTDVDTDISTVANTKIANTSNVDSDGTGRYS